MGVTVEKVYAAADALRERGETPTLAAVRRELGRGSFTTISEAMRSWRKRRQRDQTAPPPALPAQLEELASQYAQVTVRAVWEAVQEQLKAQSDADRLALNELREQMEAEGRETAELADSLSADLEQSRISLHAAQEVQDTLRQDLADARRENAELRAQLESLTAHRSEWEKRIGSLKQQRDAYQCRCLELERSAARSTGQWQAEREALERNLRELRSERDALLRDCLQGGDRSP